MSVGQNAFAVNHNARALHLLGRHFGPGTEQVWTVVRRVNLYHQIANGVLSV
jgi:hypothetical protein